MKAHFTQKKTQLALGIYLLIVIVASAMFGGQEILQSLIGTPAVATGETQGISRSALDGYNQGVVAYQTGNFEKSQKDFQEALNHPETEKRVLDFSLYNLGNTLFRLAEKEKSPETSLENYKKALQYYREQIAREKEALKYSPLKSEVDPDLLANFSVTKQRIKILTDQIKKQKQNPGNSEKSLYQLLVALLDEEKAISKELVALDKMRGEPQAYQTLRESLIQRREKNLAQISQIQQKLIQQSPSPAQNHQISPPSTNASPPFKYPSPAPLRPTQQI